MQTDLETEAVFERIKIVVGRIAFTTEFVLGDYKPNLSWSNIVAFKLHFHVK